MTATKWKRGKNPSWRNLRKKRAIHDKSHKIKAKKKMEKKNELRMHVAQRIIVYFLIVAFNGYIVLGYHRRTSTLVITRAAAAAEAAAVAAVCTQQNAFTYCVFKWQT